MYQYHSHWMSLLYGWNLPDFCQTEEGLSIALEEMKVAAFDQQHLAQSKKMEGQELMIVVVVLHCLKGTGALWLSVIA